MYPVSYIVYALWGAERACVRGDRRARCMSRAGHLERVGDGKALTGRAADPGATPVRYRSRLSEDTRTVSPETTGVLYTIRVILLASVESRPVPGPSRRRCVCV